MIDWTNPAAQVTEHFTVRDCIYLHAWDRLATLADGADFSKLETLCQKAEQVRAALSCPMNVHCMFRSQAYNAALSILPTSDVHSLSEAMDFDCDPSLSIIDIQAALRLQLEALGIRMEKGTTTWVHIDVRAVGPSGREFTVE